MTPTTAATGAVDQHGNPTSAPADAVALYDRAVDRLLRYHPDVVTYATRLAEEHPGTAIAQILVAYLHVTSTDVPDLATARAAHAALVELPRDERERGHGDAIGAWLAGDWCGAAAALDRVLLRWPSDLLALLVGHQLDFFVGDAANLRDRPGRSLRQLDPGHPHTPFVRGMQAFGLEESGHYEAAEEAGLAALEAHPDDVWALHAVVHTYEMRGRVDTGIRFLREREGDWAAGNLFTVHNWWHLALYLLEAGDVAGVLAVHDAEVHHGRSAGVPLEMVDASALLWRLHLDGVDVGDRFAALADAWAIRATVSPWYSFNDLHAVMAMVGAGRLDDAEQVIERLTAYVHRNGGATNVKMTAQVALPAARGLLRFGQGRYDDAVAVLAPIRRHTHRFGGSHAQRDVLARTLLEAAQRAGDANLVRALVSERLAVRPDSVWTLLQRARVLAADGDTAGAEAATTAAADRRARFAAAAAAAR